MRAAFRKSLSRAATPPRQPPPRDALQSVGDSICRGANVTDELTFTLLPRQQQGSNYDWMNIDFGDTRVGKVRGVIDGNTLTINSINIFPAFERRGYATKTIQMFKATFDTIVADRVRYTAVGFWQKMGFDCGQRGAYVWRGRQQQAFRRESHRPE